VDPLDELISQETVQEILALLTPAELMVFILRADGMSDTQIAEFLGIGRMAVYRRVERAQRRIMRRLPEVADMVRGRKKQWAKPR
jgi:DNA-directed RNA polymerase specialized sigma24 family protein